MIGWVQRTSDAIPHHAAFKDTTDSQHVAGLHLQTAWQHQIGDNSGLRLFASYTLAHRSTDLSRTSRRRRRSNRRRSDAVAARSRHRQRPHLVARRASQPHRRRAQPARRRRSLRRRVERAVGVQRTRRRAAQRPAGARVGLHRSGPAVRLARAIDRRVSSATASRCRPRVTVDGGLRFEAIGGSAAGRTARIGWLRPSAARRLSLDDVQLLGARRVRQLRPLRPPSAAERSRLRRSTAPTASIYRWNATTAGLPQQSDIGPLVAASRSRHRRRRGILVDRSGAEASVPGRSWCSASTRGRARGRFCALPRWAGARRTLSASSDIGVPESTLHDGHRAGHGHRRRRLRGRSAR